MTTPQSSEAGGLEDRPNWTAENWKMLAEDLDAALDAANSRAEEARLELENVRAEADDYYQQKKRAEARIRELEEALREACDVAIWMSGSPSFGPDGEAGDAWPAQRERLYKALDALSQATKREDYHTQDGATSKRVENMRPATKREECGFQTSSRCDDPDCPNDVATKREGTEKVTHGRHCSCRACGAQDWSEPQLAPCGMHGSKCPPVYDPRGYAGEVVATKREGEE